jgi:hypothetical protein
MGAAQRRTTEIARGLFAVRYVGAEDAAQPPRVKVTVDDGSEAHVDLILHPDHEEPVLSHPGTCLIVRAMMPGSLEIEVEPSMRGGSIAATVNIEPLSQGDVSAFGQEDVSAAESIPPQRRPRGRAGTLANDIRVLGHIAGIGDVDANANEWLAGPTAPSRIEGISIEWPTKPEDLDIGYSVKTAQPLSISGRIVDLGGFAGTRGRAMALTSVMFELSGPEAAQYQFAVEALFLGSPVMRASGERVVVSGPTGREPLVGLRVAIEETANHSKRAAQATPKIPTQRPPIRPAQEPARSSGRVRVFRSRPKEKPDT